MKFNYKPSLYLLSGSVFFLKSAQFDGLYSILLLLASYLLIPMAIVAYSSEIFKIAQLKLAKESIDSDKH